MASTRFPGKPLCDLMGKPMIQWTYEAARASGIGDQMLIATPDPEIMDACQLFGADCVLTRADHPSGTDRLAEVSEHVAADVYVNVQGDEPLIDPATIRGVAQPLLQNPDVQMASAYGICPTSSYDDPSVVKVVTDQAGFALYFSRWCLPFQRSGERSLAVKQHIGIYAFRRDLLQAFAGWPVSPLENAESLEQLRFLEHGVRIAMVEAKMTEVSVDNPEQADQVRAILAQRFAGKG